MGALAVEIQRGARAEHMVHPHRSCPLGAEPRVAPDAVEPDAVTRDAAAVGTVMPDAVAPDLVPSSASSGAPSYSEYLQLPALLSLQRPLGTPVVHDEMLFIIVHQTHELWFKQILCELSRSVSAIDALELAPACAALDRTTKIVRLLGEHMSVLETMPAQEFERFRAALGTASGLESEQFRRLERLAGSLPGTLPAESSAGGSQPAASVSVRQAFWRSLPEAHAPLAEPLRARDVSKLGAQLAVWLDEPALELHRGLARAMLAFDRQLVLWRRQHFEMARRMIGDKLGTGGSSGAPYLRSTMDRRFFPELWSVDSR
jgi:tryptophan 2,3-dioxygenase